MAHSCVENYLHIIFSTKNRECTIPSTLDTQLHSYIAGSHLERLKKYIEIQKEHHKKITFKEEIDTLNRQWGTTWMKD